MQGQLFTQDFLLRGVRDTPAWAALDEQRLIAFRERLQAIFAGRDAAAFLNEAQTEAEIIAPVLDALDWGDAHRLPQVNLSSRRREDVPDWLLFPDVEAKQKALPLKDDQRPRHGIALLEAKRWLRPLDRGDASEPQDPDAPSSQMLRYLSRADVMSDRAIKWGVLTNGAVWRLYWQDARSRSEQFFEIDLALALGVPGAQADLDAPPPEHALRLFALFFERAAFLPQEWDNAARTLHAVALDEARLYEEKVSADLGQRVFSDIFPALANALARADLHAQTESVGYGQFTRKRFTADYLEQVREAALVLLYRLLFLFYAEDRNLLPVRDARYAEYSVRRIRETVRDKIEAGSAFSGTLDHIWRDLQGVFSLIDEGDDSIGMPAYNGGLFARKRSPLLVRARVPDKVMAPIIDALSRRTEDILKGWINYRDLSVSHLGGIYERLLEYSLTHEVQARDDYKDKPEIDRIVARPASFARKISGSYYTHDDLVHLVLRESVGLLAQEKMAAFEQRLNKWKKRASLSQPQWLELDGDPDARIVAIDPATQLLELKICDPAMGSGHFLVALVDFLADRVLEAITAAGEQVAAQPWAAHLVELNRPWQSPVLSRIAHIRRSIKQNAQKHGWSVNDAQLDDRHIVRRMILKKCIFGVDKNHMAVELAKTALWLHTFTVGAPLSFLDHHLQTGDSLHGERFETVERGLHQLGALFQQGEIQRLKAAASAIAQVADLTDADISEVQQSQELAAEAARQLAPIHAVLDFWRALRWLIPGWPVDKLAQLQKLLKNQPQTLAALACLLDPKLNLVATLAQGELPQQGDAAQAANALMQQARELAARETFFHWWSSFPTVFGAGGAGGFDLVLGNPPWDRIKLQQVEWFAERNPRIAEQTRAADRTRLIAELRRSEPDLWKQYQQAAERAETQARVVGKGRLGSGDYPLLGGGDVNLYSLFVERAQALVAPGGMVALVVPSGIAADKGAAEFFRSISVSGRLGGLFDFENRKALFPDVDSRFKFCVLLFGGSQRRFEQARCAFFLHSLDELDSQPERTLALSADDFARVNPNTGAAPIFRSRRDADITLGIYARHPVLVRHGPQGEQKAWPVKYTTMFHMTNDSDKFLKPDELARGGWQRAPLNRWRKGRGQGAVQALPLYVGKMIYHYNHRASGVQVNAGKLKVATQSAPSSIAQLRNPGFHPEPQYWVAEGDIPASPYEWALGFRDITNATNERTMVAAIVPASAAGNKLPLLIPQGLFADKAAAVAAKLLANLNSLAFDFVLRQKLQGTTLNWYIVEQLPVIAPARFDAPLPAAFAQAARKHKLLGEGAPAQPAGAATVADFVLAQALALSYTAHDLAPFARDLGCVDAAGQALPPMIWDDEQRRVRLAALDALFFWLYDLGADDAGHVLEQFPIVREHDERAFGRWRTREDVLYWRALLPP